MGCKEWTVEFQQQSLTNVQMEKGIIYHKHLIHWVQVWGLPFENMSEEVGRDLGNRLGKYIETDKWSWLSEQAKFIRIHVDLPIDRPLRKGSNIVNPKGEKFWVTFKYERLPTFSFLCGILGHDEKHCSGKSSTSKAHKQYRDWLQANGGSKLGSETFKKSNSNGFKDHREGGSVDQQLLWPLFQWTQRRSRRVFQCPFKMPLCPRLHSWVMKGYQTRHQSRRQQAIQPKMDRLVS